MTNPEPLATQPAGDAALRARLAELEQLSAEQQATIQGLRDDAMRYMAMTENSREGAALSRAGVIMDVNNQLATMMACDRTALIGMRAIDTVIPADAAIVTAHIQAGDASPYRAHMRRLDAHGGIFLAECWGKMIPFNGELTRVTTFRDISAQEQAEAVLEQRLAAEATIRAQAAALAELSTPLFPISDRAVVMPLIGSIDAARAQQIMAALLEGVSARRADVAIIDITGVPLVDTHVADVLLKAASAVTLLGAQTVLTGIRPEVAQALVGLGVNLNSLITRGTLQGGITYALARA